ncbi:hypothetical protein ACFVX3_31660 [Rhodococcus erythropolis]
MRIFDGYIGPPVRVSEDARQPPRSSTGWLVAAAFVGIIHASDLVVDREGLEARITQILALLLPQSSASHPMMQSNSKFGETFE